MDLKYNSALATTVSGGITHATNYTYLATGDETTPGTITALSGNEQPNIGGTPVYATLGSGVILAARVEMKATAVGQIQFATVEPSGESGVGQTPEELLVLDTTGTINGGSSGTWLTSPEIQQGAVTGSIVAFGITTPGPQVTKANSPAPVSGLSVTDPCYRQPTI